MSNANKTTLHHGETRSTLYGHDRPIDITVLSGLHHVGGVSVDLQIWMEALHVGISITPQAARDLATRLVAAADRAVQIADDATVAKRAAEAAVPPAPSVEAPLAPRPLYAEPEAAQA